MYIIYIYIYIYTYICVYIHVNVNNKEHYFSWNSGLHVADMETCEKLRNFKRKAIKFTKINGFTFRDHSTRYVTYPLFTPAKRIDVNDGNTTHAACITYEIHLLLK